MTTTPKHGPLYGPEFADIAEFLGQIERRQMTPTVRQLYHAAVRLLHECQRCRADREPMTQRMKALGAKLGHAEKRGAALQRRLEEEGIDP
jgi:hypothetical protein